MIKGHFALIFLVVIAFLVSTSECTVSKSKSSSSLQRSQQAILAARIKRLEALKKLEEARRLRALLEAREASAKKSAQSRIISVPKVVVVPKVVNNSQAGVRRSNQSNQQRRSQNQQNQRNQQKRNIVVNNQRRTNQGKK